MVDEQAALVATFNMCVKYFTRTRDYGVITDDPLHVAQIVEVFNADWDHADWVPAAYDGLLWSNSNSRLHMARFIDTAKHRVDVQHPKFVDAVILDHIAAAADRGVKVHVLCGGRHGISEWDVLDTFASLRTLRRFGVKVHKQKNLRVHAKLLIVDDEHALVGSMNIDRSAFDLRRELGITITDPAVVARLRPSSRRTGTLSHHYDAAGSAGPGLSTPRTTSRTTPNSSMSEGPESGRRRVSLVDLGLDVQPHRAGVVRRRAVGVVARGAGGREEVDGRGRVPVRHDDVPHPARRQPGQHGGVRRHQDAGGCPERSPRWSGCA